MRKLSIFVAVIFVCVLVLNTVQAQEENDPVLLATLQSVNVQLEAMGLNIRASEIHMFNIGNGRSSARILQQPFHWVPNDPNRNADGTNLTYMIVPDATASGVSAADSTAAIQRSLATWNDERCLRRGSLVERPYEGEDVTIFDSFFGFGGAGNPFAADIVNAGWYSPAFFQAAGASPTGTLAFSVTFTFVNDDGSPADTNGDGYVDTALNEVYYNDTFGAPGPRLGNPWGIDSALPGIDIETVALHENGHSLGLGHFGVPPVAVMNPIYGGIRHEVLATDHAGFCAAFSNWPNR